MNTDKHGCFDETLSQTIENPFYPCSAVVKHAKSSGRITHPEESNNPAPGGIV
jgi:hypothetical protein